MLGVVALANSFLMEMPSTKLFTSETAHCAQAIGHTEGGGGVRPHISDSL